MKIYEITWKMRWEHEPYPYGVVYSHVLVASSKKKAIELAGSISFSGENWDNSLVTELGLYSGENKKPFIVMTLMTGS